MGNKIGVYTTNHYDIDVKKKTCFMRFPPLRK